MEFIKKLANPFFKHCFIVLFLFISIFFIQRCSLLLINLGYFSDVPISELIQSFFVALRFDVRSALYLLSAYYLIVFIFYIIGKSKPAEIFAKIYLSFSALIFVLLGIVELYFFDYFHVRLNSYTLNTFDNPNFVFQMLWESYPLIPLGIFSLIVLIIFYKLFKSVAAKYFISFQEDKLIFKVSSFLIISLLSAIGIRGSLEIKTPLRWGHAFFSEHTKANQLALNYVFTLVDDISHKTDKNSYKKHLTVNNKDQAIPLVKSLISDSSSVMETFPVRKYYYTDTMQINQVKPNVVLILLESFSQTKIDNHTKLGYNLFINSLADQSINFKNCYSNGFHTYMGLFSTIAGLPNAHATNIMKRTEGRQKFSSLPGILKSNGYSTYFGISHVPNFDNMGGFMSINGTDKIISEFDFDKSEVLSSLGVPDHRLFEKMNKLFSTSEKPFFATILSSNNHGPWIIPEVEGNSFDNTFVYTDWALDHLFELASKEEYFENTIFVVTADHGIPENPIYDFDLSATHVPLLMYAPKYLKPEVRKNIMSHIDIQETILGILNLPHRTANYSRNILSFENSEDGFALVQEGNKVGLIYDNWYLIDRLGSNSSLYKYNSPNREYDYSKDSIKILEDLQKKLHSLYYISNEMIYDMKASAESY